MWSYRKFEKLKSLEILLQNCSVMGKLQVLTAHKKKKKRLGASEFSVTVYMFLFIFLYQFCF